MKKGLIIISALFLLSLPLTAFALSVAVNPADWNDSRTTPIADGVLGNGDWDGGDNLGFQISWDISLDGSYYTYEYTLSGVDGLNLSKGLSHWILEVTDPSEKDNFTWLSASIKDGDSLFTTTDASIIDDIVSGPETFTGTGNSGSNPLMPGDIYGIKFDADDLRKDLGGLDGGDVDVFSVIFKTTKDPVWGDFYAKSGNALPFTVAWNTGFGDPASPDFTYWIPTPNGGTPVPEPATMLLLGLGLIGLAGIGRKQARKLGST